MVFWLISFGIGTFRLVEEVREASGVTLTSDEVYMNTRWVWFVGVHVVL